MFAVIGHKRTTFWRNCGTMSQCRIVTPLGITLMFGAFEAVSVLTRRAVFEFDVTVAEQNVTLFKSIFPTSLETFAPLWNSYTNVIYMPGCSNFF